MAGTEKQKQSLYFPEDTLREIMREANRLDRSLSWTVQQAWRIARDEVRKFPAVGPRAEAQRVVPPPPAREVRAETGRRDGEIVDRPPSEQVRDFLRGKFDREQTS